MQLFALYMVLVIFLLARELPLREPWPLRLRLWRKVLLLALVHLADALADLAAEGGTGALAAPWSLGM